MKRINKIQHTKHQLNLFPVGVALLLCATISGMAGAEPELKIIRQEESAHLSHVYKFTCEISWTGDGAAYTIAPAEFDAIDWGQMTVSSIKAAVSNGANVVTQTIEIVPDKTGEHKVPEIRITYLTPEATSPAEKADTRTAPPDSSASPSLRADPFTLKVRSSRLPLWISGGLGASLILIASITWWIMRRIRRTNHQVVSGGKTASIDLSAIQSQLHHARQRRLDGNFYEYYRELTRTAELLENRTDKEKTSLAAQLHARAQEVGYRGVRPTDDQMDGDFRDIERALARYKEDLQA